MNIIQRNSHLHDIEDRGILTNAAILRPVLYKYDDHVLRWVGFINRYEYDDPPQQDAHVYDYYQTIDLDDLL